MKKTYYQLSVRDPGAVAWYCAVKLEMATALTAALLTEQLQSDGVPGLGDAQEKMQAELGSRMGVDISVGGHPRLAPLWPGRRLVCVLRVELRGHHPRAHGLLGGRRPAHRQDRRAS